MDKILHHLRNPGMMIALYIPTNALVSTMVSFRGAEWISSIHGITCTEKEPFRRCSEAIRKNEVSLGPDYPVFPIEVQEARFWKTILWERSLVHLRWKLYFLGFMHCSRGAQAGLSQLKTLSQSLAEDKKDGKRQHKQATKGET